MSSIHNWYAVESGFSAVQMQKQFFFILLLFSKPSSLPCWRSEPDVFSQLYQGDQPLTFIVQPTACLVKHPLTIKKNSLNTTIAALTQYTDYLPKFTVPKWPWVSWNSDCLLGSECLMWESSVKGWAPLPGIRCWSMCWGELMGDSGSVWEEHR